MRPGFLEYAVIVNRTSGPIEIVYDGVPVIFGPRERKTVPVELAQHVFTLDKASAFDATGQYVRLLGLAEGPDHLLGRIDPLCLDCDPVTLGSQPGYRKDLITEGTAVSPLAVRGHNHQELLESQAVPGGGGFKALATE